MPYVSFDESITYRTAGRKPIQNQEPQKEALRDLMDVLESQGESDDEDKAIYVQQSTDHTAGML